MRWCVGVISILLKKGRQPVHYTLHPTCIFSYFFLTLYSTVRILRCVSCMCCYPILLRENVQKLCRSSGEVRANDVNICKDHGRSLTCIPYLKESTKARHLSICLFIKKPEHSVLYDHIFSFFCAYNAQKTCT